MGIFRRPEGVSAEHWMKQEAEFAAERESIERQREEAKRFVAKELRGRANILVFDLGGVTDPSLSGDEQLEQEVRELQFGGSERATYGEAYKYIMGFEKDDPQVTVWEAFRNQDLPDMPYPDAFVTTGGPAMPSELEPGNETENTVWLRRATEIMRELKENNVPGVAICLGHQLWNYMEGAQVGRTGGGKREYGTPAITAHDIAKEIQVLQGFWDEQDTANVSASHSEGVLALPDRSNIEVIAWNSYMPIQGTAHSSREGQSMQEADAADELVVTLQNHPEVIARWLETLRRVRGSDMQKEGLDIHNMLFHNTEQARSIWMRFLELTQRRLEKRSS